MYCSYPHPRGNEQGGTRPSSIHRGEYCLGRFLSRNRFPSRRIVTHDVRCSHLDHEVCTDHPLNGFQLRSSSGYDAPFHLSEECSNANIAAPRAIVLTSGVGGLFGWFLQLVVAYTVIDIDSVIKSDLGQPWASYLLQVLPHKVALAALALTIIAAFSMGQGCMVNAQ